MQTDYKISIFCSDRSAQFLHSSAMAEQEVHSQDAKDTRHELTCAKLTIAGKFIAI